MISGKYSRAGRPGLAQLVDFEGGIVKYHGHTGRYLQQHLPRHLSSYTNQTSPTPTITKHPDTDPDRGHNVHQSPNFRQSMQRIISWLGHRYVYSLKAGHRRGICCPHQSVIRLLESIGPFFITELNSLFITLSKLRNYESRVCLVDNISAQKDF